MDEQRVLLTHGGGGRLMRDLIRDVMLPAFDNPSLGRLEDSAEVPWPSARRQGDPQSGDMRSGRVRSSDRRPDGAGDEASRGPGRLAMTTDGYVVRPIFFPGGDIGKLSLCGTVNDLATAGARPLALSAGFIIEEGFALDDLKRVVRSMEEAARTVPVHFVTGDTKVVERGRGDGIYITTTGVGLVPHGVELSPKRVEPGDAVVINGPVGSHEAAIIGARNDFGIGVEARSDCAPLYGLMEGVLEEVPDARCARDPTRGGLTAALTEIVESSGFGIELVEEDIPVEEPVRSLCELLGLDPLLLANEGKMIVVVPAARAGDCVSAMKRSPYGAAARVIGRVHDRKARLTVRTPYGTTRVVTMPAGDQLPRIC